MESQNARNVILEKVLVFRRDRLMDSDHPATSEKTLKINVFKPKYKLGRKECDYDINQMQC
jgi:hypothetical protein